MKPLCFVLMPFGRKQTPSGQWIDYDAVYQEIIAPAIIQTGLDPIRADEEQVGGTIHKPMYERLMLCEYAIADVTGANPNVYYELGIRHALRPRSTVILFATGTTLPFDIALLRGTPYNLDSDGKPCEKEQCISMIVGRLKAASDAPHDDSPIFNLIEDMPRIQVDHEKTDIFRERVTYSREVKNRLAEARSSGVAAVRELEQSLPNIRNLEAGILVELFLAYRGMKAYAEMIELYGKMPRAVQHVRIIQEQLALAQNRMGNSEEAEKILEETIARFGQSSETNGLLGRVYKDRWEKSLKAGNRLEARGFLKRAIEAYRIGFEADWRDPYPGINAVTLMELEDKPNPAQSDILPVVRYAARMRAKSNGDYWDHATLLELAVLARDIDEAFDSCSTALALVREPFEPETTSRNLRLIREARTARGEDSAWISDIEGELKAIEIRCFR